MRPVLELIERVGPSDANVLITGENGTGKGARRARAARRLRRAPRPFLTVNAGGLSEGVFESELFGHVKGAFTDAQADRVGRFELADGGTLFLDEIAQRAARASRPSSCACSRPASSSASARRARGACDVRILSATNADLPAEVAAGRFRQDLLFRLNTIEIHLPPLRERREDIPLLARHFLRRHARALPQERRRASTPRRWRRCSPTPGRATSASSTTRSSAPC